MSHHNPGHEMMVSERRIQYRRIWWELDLAIHVTDFLLQMKPGGGGGIHILRHMGMCHNFGLVSWKKSPNMGHIFHEKIPNVGQEKKKTLFYGCDRPLFSHLLIFFFFYAKKMVKSAIFWTKICKKNCEQEKIMIFFFFL